MTQEEISESNKLIAEFMKLKKSPLIIDKEPLYFMNGTHTNARYNTSWDWLIPVIKKTRDKILNPRLHIQLNDALLELDIEKVYKLVVGLIKYNSKNL